MKKRIQQFLSAFFIAALLLQTGVVPFFGSPTYQAEAAVKISKSKLTVQIGATSKLTISTSKKIVWVSTNTDIATVSSKGVVSGIAEGTCTVYGIVGTTAYKCAVTVKKAPKKVLSLANKPLPSPLPIAAPAKKAAKAKTVLTAQNSLNIAVDTSSAKTSSYSSSKEASGRTPIYFYHPRRLVLTDQQAEVLFWVSSNSNVIRVYSDGSVEAFAEGIADVTAYDKAGNPIETFPLYATTYNDADPIGSKVDYTDKSLFAETYRNIEFQDIQESINNITDYVAYLYAVDAFYSFNMEGSNPRPIFNGESLWVQSGNSDWIFKNNAGICCNVCAGAIYALVGDYERSGIIQLAGKNGHTIYWCFENGTYYVYDFTRIISERSNYVNNAFSGNIYNYVDSTIGRGKTLLAALQNCSDKSNSGYFENYIIYAVDLTGLDYYPAESNNWMSTGDFTKTCIAYFAEGTKVEPLYTAKGIKFKAEFVSREKIPNAMRVYTTPTDTSGTHTDTNLGRLRTVAGPGTTNAAKITLSTTTGNVAYAQSKLLTTIDYSSKKTSSFEATMTKEKRTPVYLYETKHLNAGSSKIAFWYSSDSNIIRVRSDGTVKVYSEGTADIYAVNSKGKVLKTFKLYATTHADSDPLADTIGDGSGYVAGMTDLSMYEANTVPTPANVYQQITLEDVPNKLHTLTDYTAWIYANYAYPNMDEEPQSPNAMRFLAVDSGARWFANANDDCVFTNYSGVCCNFAAGAIWALAGDYEANGLIMMNGPYGHVINWFYENGKYYVIDYMCVAEEHSKIQYEYNSDVLKYVTELIGTGKTLKDALYDYYTKNPSRSFYFRNSFMYSTTATGYNLYQADCNNWSSHGILSKNEGVNTLYCSEANVIELLYKTEVIDFEYQYIAPDLIPATQKTLYSLNIMPYYTPAEQLKKFDNTKLTADEYNLKYGTHSNSGNNGNSTGSNSGNNSGDSGNSGSGSNNSSSGSGDMSRSLYLFGIYDTYASYWGIADGIDYPADYVIPDTWDGFPVTEIGDYALCGKRGIRTLTIPKSITKIYDSSFLGIEQTTTFRVSAGSYAEDYCKSHGLNYEVIK